MLLYLGADASADNILNHRAAGAVAAFTRCVPAGASDQICETFVIEYTTSSVTPVGPQASPLARGLDYEHYAAVVHPDGSVDEFIAEFGGIPAPPGDFDRARLSFAWVDGGTIDLFNYDATTGQLVANGRKVTLGRFTWTAASGVYVFGNDGPFGFGLPRFYIDRCSTQISNGHERFTAARVTGTIDHVSVTTLDEAYLPWPGTGPDDARGAVFDNEFTITQQAHGPNCQP